MQPQQGLDLAPVDGKQGSSIASLDQDMRPYMLFGKG